MPRSMEKALCLGFCEFCHEPHSNNNNVIEVVDIIVIGMWVMAELNNIIHLTKGVSKS